MDEHDDVKENPENSTSRPPTEIESNEAQKQKPSAPVFTDSRLKQLEEEHFIVKSKPKDHAKSQFFCRVCTITFDTITEDKIRQHINGKSHKKNVKNKGRMLTMKKVANPSLSQVKAMEALLDSVAKQHALIPDTDFSIRLQIAQEMTEVIQSKIPDTKLHLYGSSLTCFGFKSSDVNLDLTLHGEIKAPQALISIKELLMTNDKCTDVKEEFDLTVPQISFIHKKTGLTCRLCCGNELACKTSQLLKHYAELNPIVCKLVVGFRFWAQRCSIVSKTDGGLTPYCLALIVIQFLQNTTPPILPMLDTEQEYQDGEIQKFVSQNTTTLGSLWFKLFRYYCVEFQLDETIISIRMKQPYNRQERRWGHRRLAIEDPYITNHNVSTVNSDKVFEYIITCMNTSYIYFGSIPKAKQRANKATTSHTTFDAWNDDVEVHEKKLGSQPKSDDKLHKQSQSADKDDEDAIFQMDDLKDGNGSTDQESQTRLLEHKMKDLTVTKQADVTVTSANHDNLHGTAISSSNDCSELEIVYEFTQEILSGGKRPEVQCQCCKRDGHVTTRCPDLRKPVLKPLPSLNTRYLDLVSRVCVQTRGEVAFAPQEMKYRGFVLWNLEDYIQEVFPDSRLHLFGSSINGFGFRDSDLDICMTIDGKNKEDVDSIHIIKDLAKKLKQHRDCTSVVAITTAKVPIVKFYLRSVRREADISLYNVLALENTKMLATYARMDERVSILGYTLKLFAKLCDIGDASKGSLSSYAYILMLLHYLQKRNPPVIPVLQQLYEGDTQPSKLIDNWNCWFFDDMANLHKVWTANNTESVGSLWIGFLRYYTETFDWEHDVICCRNTKTLTKFEKMWTRHIFAIEDPFNLDHNLGAGISRRMGNFIKTALVRGRQRFGIPAVGMPSGVPLLNYYFNADFLTDGLEAPSDRTCRVCGHIGHLARECPRLRRNRHDERVNEDRSKLCNRPFAAPNVTPRKRAATAPVYSPQKDLKSDSRKPLESFPSNPTLKDIPCSTSKTNAPQERHSGTSTQLPLQRNEEQTQAQIAGESHPNTKQTIQVGKESSTAAITHPPSPGIGSPKATPTAHPCGFMPSPTITSHQIMTSSKPVFIQSTSQSPIQPGRQSYPLFQTQPTPPRMNPEGPWSHPNLPDAWPTSPLVEEYRLPQSRIQSTPDQPHTRHRSVSESMATGDRPQVMMPFGSPPHVYRRDVPFGFAPAATNVYPRPIGSPIMYPSSLPSYLQQQPNTQQQQQQQHVTQSPPQPRPSMPTAYGGHMTADEFFTMFREAESSSTKQPDFTPCTIPCDAVLSHPVVKPIFSSPKTEDEHKLFSKLDKVRSLWTGEATLPVDDLPAQAKEQGDDKLDDEACSIEVQGCTSKTDINQGNDSESMDGVKILSKSNPAKSKSTKYQPNQQKRDEHEMPGLSSQQSSNHPRSNPTMKSSDKKQGLLGDGPTAETVRKGYNKTPPNSTSKEVESSLFDLKSYQKAFPVKECVDISRTQKHNERENSQETKISKNINEKSREDTSSSKRKGSKKGAHEAAPPKRRKSKHVEHEESSFDKSEDHLDKSTKKGNCETKGNRRAKSSFSRDDMKTPDGKCTFSTASNGKGTANTASNGKGAATGKGTSSTASNGKGAANTASNGKGAANTASNGKGAANTASNGKGATNTASNGKGAANTASNGKGAATGKGTTSTASNGKGTANTMSNGKGAANTASNGKGAANTASNGKGATTGKGTASTASNSKAGTSSRKTSQSIKGERSAGPKYKNTETLPVDTLASSSSGPSPTKKQDSEAASKLTPDRKQSKGKEQSGEGAGNKPANRQEDSKEGTRRPRHRNRGKGRAKGNASQSGPRDDKN